MSSIKPTMKEKKQKIKIVVSKLDTSFLKNKYALINKRLIIIIKPPINGVGNLCIFLFSKG
jgi:SpoU rRNA methylase family enzyme